MHRYIEGEQASKEPLALLTKPYCSEHVAVTFGYSEVKRKEGLLKPKAAPLFC